MTGANPSLRYAALTAIVMFGLLLVSRADTVVLIPVADATLLEAAPSNSLGGATWMTAGTTQNFTTNRALMLFDITNTIPRGAKITAAKLTVSVTRAPPSMEHPPDSSFTIRRMLRPWGEGNGQPTEESPGLGSEAQLGDASWYQPFFGTTNFWTVAGGAEGIDFSGTISGSTQIAREGDYEFEPLVELMADVQFWLDYPESNFGLLLKTESEDMHFTARRFGSRESADFDTAPRLMIDFTPTPMISGARKIGGMFQFVFNADAGSSYAVETLGALSSSNSWTTLTNYGVIGASTNVTFTTPATNAMSFFRVRRN